MNELIKNTEIPERTDPGGQSEAPCYTVLDLFSGIGGFSLGLERTGGFRTVAFCEIEAFPRRVLHKHWPDVPIFEDIKELHATDLPEPIDVVCGGFPCQDISSANSSGVGIDGARSGLWREMAEIISVVRPRYAFVENSPALAYRGLGKVLGDLAGMGMDARWGVFSACSTGAPHTRARMFILAYSKGERPGQLRRLKCQEKINEERNLCWPSTEPPVARVADGVAHRLDRLTAGGNGQVPAVVRLAFEALRG